MRFGEVLRLHRFMRKLAIYNNSFELINSITYPKEQKTQYVSKI